MRGRIYGMSLWLWMVVVAVIAWVCGRYGTRAALIKRVGLVADAMGQDMGRQFHERMSELSIIEGSLTMAIKIEVDVAAVNRQLETRHPGGKIIVI